MPLKTQPQPPDNRNLRGNYQRLKICGDGGMVAA